MSSVLPVIIQSETINDNIEEEVKDEELYDEEGGMTFDGDEEEELPPKASVPQEEVFKEPEPPKKKKRVITDAQREHLAKARLKAAEVRKRKTQEKKLRLAQEKRAEEKLRKEVAPKQRPKKAAKETVLHNPMESDEEDEPVEVVLKKKAISFDDIDPELMAKISSMAVEKYDVKRKARKQEKLNKQKEVAEEQKVYKTVSEAINPPGDADDFYAQCFQ